MSGAFDKTGTIFLPLDYPHDPYEGVTWEDLDPFTQGYVEAMFQTDLHPPSSAVWGRKHYLWLYATYRDLAPETLAMVLRDCEAKVQAMVNCGASRTHEDTRDNGQRFWSARQRGNFDGHGFPPFTPYVADDGKVRLREVAP
jgi:hypothetical protein